MIKKTDLVLSMGQRVLLLFCLFLVCYVLTMAGSYVLGRILAHNPAGAVRIGAVLQDVLAFIIPAVVTALLVTRKPAELLCLSTKPSLTSLLLVIVIAFVSIPAQEAVIYWNYNISLPESMANFEAMARQFEANASDSIKLLLGDTSVAALIVNVLIIGVFAGFSEEILFRGCYLRLLTTGGPKLHRYVWVAAFIFSALHFQLFGFVPRMLLGAYFGYLLVWTGSIWVPVFAHVLNNTMYVITAWYQVKESGISVLDAEPTLYSTPLIIGSVIATAICLYGVKQLAQK